MTRSHKVLGFLLVAVLGIYGCARGPAGASGDRHAALEAKVQRQLEQDRTAAAQERDALQTQVKARTAERDHFQSQHGNFIKALKEQLDKAETAMNTPSAPAAPAVAGAQSSGTITTTAAPN
jgi:hypothetical protein